MIAVNLTGTFLTFREGLRQMDGWGRLIAIASTAGLKGYAPYVAPMPRPSTGWWGWCGRWRWRCAKPDHGQRDLSRLSGYRDDRTLGRQHHGQDRQGSADEALAALTCTNPQHRLIAPSEVTAAALWLWAPGAEGINGQAIAIERGAR
jgi:3-hydroxybutyrate dehydrogenase